MPAGLRDLLRYTHATAIVHDLLKIRARDVGLGDMAIVEMPDGAQSLAQAIQLDGDEVSLQVFGGGKGLSTHATVRFLGHPAQVTCSPNILGRVFRGDGQPMDGGPDLSGDRRVAGSPSASPQAQAFAATARAAVSGGKKRQRVKNRPSVMHARRHRDDENEKARWQDRHAPSWGERGYADDRYWHGACRDGVY